MTFGASQTEEINVGIAIKANDISITFIAASIGITAKTITNNIITFTINGRC